MIIMDEDAVSAAVRLDRLLPIRSRSRCALRFSRLSLARHEPHVLTRRNSIHQSHAHATDTCLPSTNDDIAGGGGDPTSAPTLTLLAQCGEVNDLTRSNARDALERERATVRRIAGTLRRHAGTNRMRARELAAMTAEAAAAAEEEEEEEEEDGHDDGDGGGAFYLTLVPVRPRSRGERRSLRTFAVVSLRPSLAFNPRPRRLSTPTDAYELHPDFALKGRPRRRSSELLLRDIVTRAKEAKEDAAVAEDALAARCDACVAAAARGASVVSTPTPTPPALRRAMTLIRGERDGEDTSAPPREERARGGGGDGDDEGVNDDGEAFAEADHARGTKRSRDERFEPPTSSALPALLLPAGAGGGLSLPGSLEVNDLALLALKGRDDDDEDENKKKIRVTAAKDALEMIAEYASQPSPFDDDDDDDEAFAFESTERVLESTPSLGERPVAGDDDADPLDEDACECYSQPPPPSDSVSDDRRGEEEEEEEEEDDEVLKERRSPRERGRMGTSHEEEEGGESDDSGYAGEAEVSQLLSRTESQPCGGLFDGVD